MDMNDDQKGLADKMNRRWESRIQHESYPRPMQREIDQLPRHIRDDRNSSRRDEPHMHQDGKEPEISKISGHHSIPKHADYDLGVTMTELVASLKDLGDKVIWSKEMSTDSRKQSQEF